MWSALSGVHESLSEVEHADDACVRRCPLNSFASAGTETKLASAIEKVIMSDKSTHAIDVDKLTISRDAICLLKLRYYELHKLIPKPHPVCKHSDSPQTVTSLKDKMGSKQNASEKRLN